jgi:hypothetical protein
MALPTFTEGELGQSQAWLDQMNRGLASRGLADGVQSAIQKSVQRIADYTAKYDLPRTRWQRLMQPLAVADIYRETGNLHPAAEAAATAVLKELEQIRDGKFTDIPLADTPVQTVAPQAGAWGSQTRISIRPASST